MQGRYIGWICNELGSTRGVCVEGNYGEQEFVWPKRRETRLKCPQLVDEIDVEEVQVSEMEKDFLWKKCFSSVLVMFLSISCFLFFGRIVEMHSKERFLLYLGFLCCFLLRTK